MALNTPPTLLGVSGRMGEPERTEEHTRGTRARGRRRQARCQCRRTEPEALKYKPSISEGRLERVQSTAKAVVGVFSTVTELSGGFQEDYNPLAKGSCPPFLQDKG